SPRCSVSAASPPAQRKSRRSCSSSFWCCSSSRSSPVCYGAGRERGLKSGHGVALVGKRGRSTLELYSGPLRPLSFCRRERLPGPDRNARQAGKVSRRAQELPAAFAAMSPRWTAIVLFRGKNSNGISLAALPARALAGVWNELGSTAGKLEAGYGKD